MLYEQMQTQSQQIEEQLRTIDTQLKKLPKGKLFCSSNGKYYKWYLNDGEKQIYIPKKKRALAEKLAFKKYLLLQQEDLLREKRATDLYLKYHHPDIGSAEKLLIQSPEYQKLLSPFFKPLSEELLNWMNAPYERYEKYPELLTHKTSSGNLVRSKSEVIIDLSLYTHKIPFRYECALHFEDTTIFPDFTIRHPKTGQLFYWEHFGLMDDPDYSQNACSKLHLYASHGIIPSIQLITTYETKKHPLSSEIVEKIINHYFL